MHLTSANGSRTPNVFVLTFPKAGSQWIRDLLTHHRTAHISGLRDARFSCNLSRPTDSWPADFDGCVIGPVYSAQPEQWRRLRRPGDRAVVLLRDPRDLIVSWMWSYSTSHTSTATVECTRNSLLALPLSQRLLASVGFFQRYAAAFQAWGVLARGVRDEVLITTYERLIDDSPAELAAIYEHLGWAVSAPDVRRIVEDLSFETRSGRARGEADVFSHFRQGSPGDWRTSFDRASGVLFEFLFPGLLLQTGFDSDPRWHERLPVESNASAPWEDVSQLRSLVESQAEIVRLREQNRWLQAALSELRDAAESRAA